MDNEFVRKVVNSYGDFDSRTICSFVVLSDDEKIRECVIGDICHDDLKRVKPNVYDQLITSFPVQDHEVDLRFFDLMKFGMYRNWSDHIHLEKTEDGLYYIRLTDLSKIPANVVYNLCICSRFIVEYREYLGVWAKLVSEGVHPALALAICRSNVSIDKDDCLDQTITDVGSDEEHWPFYIRVSLERLMTSNPDFMSINFKTRPYACIPTNLIWGETKDLLGLKGTTIRKFSEKWKNKLVELK